MYDYTKHGRDNCKICDGVCGGVPGNENIMHNIVICDYCTATIISKDADAVTAKDALTKGDLWTARMLVRRLQASSKS